MYIIVLLFVAFTFFVLVLGVLSVLMSNKKQVGNKLMIARVVIQLIAIMLIATTFFLSGGQIATK